MAKDLTTSKIDRQNILNNELAVNEIQKQTGIQGILYEGRLRFTKSMVAERQAMGRDEGHCGCEGKGTV